MRRTKIIGLGAAAMMLAGSLAGCVAYDPGYAGDGYYYSPGYAYAPGPYYYAPAYGGVYVGGGGCCWHHHWR